VTNLGGGIWIVGERGTGGKSEKRNTWCEIHVLEGVCKEVRTEGGNTCPKILQAEERLSFPKPVKLKGGRQRKLGIRGKSPMRGRVQTSGEYEEVRKNCDTRVSIPQVNDRLHRQLGVFRESSSDKGRPVEVSHETGKNARKDWDNIPRGP